MNPLQGVRILSIATNIPGPVAAARLHSLGASLVKVEPPSGDALALASPSWYADLHQGIEVLRLDLKGAAGQERLQEYLEQCDLLLTASRPSALQRLDLAWPDLALRYPRLCQVAIVGFPPPDEEIPGHDLTYQAVLGLVDPPSLPKTVLADLAGAEWAVSAALALLYRRTTAAAQGITLHADERFMWVPLGDAAASFAEPLRRGLTAADGLLGGQLPGYNLYKARDGWIAVGALERRFLASLVEELDLEHVTREALAGTFRKQTARQWESWAAERDIPLVAVRDYDEGEVENHTK